MVDEEKAKDVKGSESSNPGGAKGEEKKPDPKPEAAPAPAPTGNPAPSAPDPERHKLAAELAESLRKKDDQILTLERRVEALEHPRKPPIFKPGIKIFRLRNDKS